MNIFKYIFPVVFHLLNFAIAGDYATSFLRLPPDAFSQSIGGSNPALTIGAADVFSNPALLSQHLTKSVQFSNIIDLRDFRFSSFAFAMPLSNRSYVGLAMESQLNRAAPTTVRENVSINLIEPSQYAVFVAVAHKFNVMSVGATIQYYQTRYQRNGIHISDKIWMLNFGGYYMLNRSLQTGLTVQAPVWIQEIPKTINLSGNIALGVIWSPSPSWQIPVKITSVANKLQDSKLKISGGLVLTPLQNTLTNSSMSFRAGIGDIDLVPQVTPSQDIQSLESPMFFTFGAGFAINVTEQLEVNLDYCYQVKEYISNQHIITTRIRF